MFFPKGFTDAVNGAVTFPTTKDGADMLPRFRRKAKTLPEARPNAVLRYSVTGASTRPKAGKGRGKVGVVGLALIAAEAERKTRERAARLKAFDRIAKSV